jgi:hypothetical protein
MCFHLTACDFSIKPDRRSCQFGTRTLLVPRENVSFLRCDEGKEHVANIKHNDLYFMQIRYYKTESRLNHVPLITTSQHETFDSAGYEVQCSLIGPPGVCGLIVSDFDLVYAIWWIGNERPDENKVRRYVAESKRFLKSHMVMDGSVVGTPGGSQKAPPTAH